METHLKRVCRAGGAYGPRCDVNDWLLFLLTKEPAQDAAKQHRDRQEAHGEGPREIALRFRAAIDPRAVGAASSGMLYGCVYNESAMRATICR